MQVAWALPEWRTDRSYTGPRPRTFPLANHWTYDQSDRAPLKVHCSALAGDTRGAAPPPWRFGRVWTSPRAASPRRARRAGAGGAAHPA